MNTKDSEIHFKILQPEQILEKSTIPWRKNTYNRLLIPTKAFKTNLKQ